ncbi:MAG: hypothetical protein HZA01_08800 [Nitrospinae bacterium]|nr:hypothetical protein [Nitrospinota bacterium]
MEKIAGKAPEDFSCFETLEDAERAVTAAAAFFHAAEKNFFRERKESPFEMRYFFAPLGCGKNRMPLISSRKTS